MVFCKTSWLVVFQILQNIMSRLLHVYASFSYSLVVYLSLMYFQQAEQLMANAVKQSMGLIDCKVNHGASN